MQFLEKLAKKIGSFDPKSYNSNVYKMKSDQQVGVPQKYYSITFLSRGGSSKMITVLHFEGGGGPSKWLQLIT